MKHNSTILCLLCAVLGACTAPDPIDIGPDTPDGPAMNPSISSVSPSHLLLYPPLYRIVDTVTVTAQYADTVYVKCCQCIGAKRISGEDGMYKFEVSVIDELNESPKFAVFAENDRWQDRKDLTVEKAYFNPERESFECHAAGATFPLSVETNVGLKAISQEPGWIHVKGNGNSLEITVDRNEGYTARTGEILLSDSRSLMQKTFTVTQEAAVNYFKEEREALEDLWEATDGRNWKSLSNTTGGMAYSTANWCTDNPIETWYGVTLDDEGHVIYLHLSGVGLVGHIPEGIGKLAYLQELWLSGNSLSGELPESIGDLKVLKDLDMSGMELSGGLENCTLGKIASHLKNVSLSGNLFTGGFPEWIGDLPETANFWLQGNCLEGKVPEKVVAHSRWKSVVLDGSGKTVGEVNMQQREGYTLSE